MNDSANPEKSKTAQDPTQLEQHELEEIQGGAIKPRLTDPDTAGKRPGKGASARHPDIER